MKAKTNDTFVVREFDMPGFLVIIAIAMAMISIVACCFIDSVVMFASEKPAWYIGELMSSGAATYTSHVWVWGRNVTYGR